MATPSIHFKKLSALCLSIFVLLFFTACSQIDRQYTSPNQNDRVQSIVFHYTAENETDSLRILQDPKALISSHYLVANDKIYQLVDLDKRAYHAGVSSWAGRQGLNDTSIGIELVQEVKCGDHFKSCHYLEYSPEQIEQLIIVLKEIKKEFPNIKPTNYVGHQDIAPNRKQDPGPLFPWKALAQQGYGAWYDEEDYQEILQQLTDHPTCALNTTDAINTFEQGLMAYGYPEIDANNQTAVIRAFQTHFAPQSITGEVNVESYVALMALLKKYYPRHYQQLMRCTR